MKHTLLSIAFFVLTSAVMAQVSSDGSESVRPQATLPSSKQAKISVYPNPATDFISINNDDNVKQIAIFNLVGRKVKSFDNIVKDQHYDVSDLPNGMYLIQVIDNANKVVTTQRVNKR
jgi:hypothetical protein